MSNTRVQMVVYKLRGLTDCPAAVKGPFLHVTRACRRRLHVRARETAAAACTLGKNNINPPQCARMIQRPRNGARKVLRNEHAVKRPPDRFLDKQGIRNVRKQRETRNTKREILNTPSCSKRPPATALYLTYSLQKILCKMNEKERKLL
ncbi:uncharacterized protein LOC105661896 isoform X1 [Megachile rotundata]|uniref:uncharacterized protein LOC105661896 isoform X1 n=1 Tax=Megachile rotundata TaxID=143995 RepID=UPI0006149C34|nr:PREDICTED: uncharacterized protein LOC105661896 [Megachile rotundata]XP_012135776.1 PREDICTED: uncharacterized protein LOC105661896 [Megachile rotundata]XP_012135777.1 PREDICTED: uncharacterized protein LOC105661896 [Megachile rotundata]XP_012135778.1 PREDICTED: uncharacterized protein LOC105661896 [Megachile rotundata]XP_012135779.1 PREDICTED: uncharacterized protein LOC105661896 [Megachile rotundata]XP_012135780.1 PREDICTED: uncharacterized protein LOC105661896 [Megachile rotundata]XP_01